MTVVIIKSYTPVGRALDILRTPASPCSCPTFAETRKYELRHKKTNVLVSDLVRHKPGCTATADGLRLEISDLGSRGVVLSV